MPISNTNPSSVNNKNNTSSGIKRSEPNTGFNNNKNQTKHQKQEYKLKTNIYEYYIENIDLGQIQPKKIKKREGTEPKYYKIQDKENIDLKSKLLFNVVYSPDEITNQTGGWNRETFNEYYNTSIVRNLNIVPTNIFKFENIKQIYDLLQKCINNNKIKYNIDETNLNRLFTSSLIGQYKDESFIYKFKYNNKKIITFGDFHGSYHTFFRHMERFYHKGIILYNEQGEPYLNEDYVLLFLGDLIDRGNHAAEILIYLLLLVKNSPNNIIINRGNHESFTQYKKDGFYNEIEKKLKSTTNVNENNAPTNVNTNNAQTNVNTNQKQDIPITFESINNSFVKFFATCPCAVILHNENSNKRIWCCHGCIPVFIGFPKDINLYRDINDETKNTIFVNNYITLFCMWNDLNVDNDTLYKSKREFTDINLGTLSEFMRETNISFVIRGHQDSDANTVIGNNGKNLNKNFNRLNPLYAANEALIEHGYDIQKIYTVDEPTESRSTNGSIAYININGVENNKLYNDNNELQDDNVNIITISNNTDNSRSLLRDSYVVIEEEVQQQTAGRRKQNRKSRKSKKQNKKSRKSNKKQNRKSRKSNKK